MLDWADPERVSAASRAMAEHGSVNPAKFYARHLETATGCRCVEGAPDPACDVGEALFRVFVSMLLTTKPVPQPLRIIRWEFTD